jgi:ribosomal protein S18 acetylase RimI-like enzyme
MEYIRATLEHTEDVTQLLNDLENFNNDAAPYTEDEFSTWDDLRDFVKEYFSDDSVVFLAKDGSKPAGYIHIFHCKPGHYCVLDELYTKEEFRGQGVGKKLLELGEEWAKTKSNQLKLEVFEWNANAQEFYKRNKYEKDSVVYVKWFQ